MNPSRRDDPGRPWGRRLALDPGVPGGSPRVAGTAIAASHIASLVAGGWTLHDILRAHPGLTSGGIHACLEYAIAEADGEP